MKKLKLIKFLISTAYKVGGIRDTQTAILGVVAMICTMLGWQHGKDAVVAMVFAKGGSDE